MITEHGEDAVLETDQETDQEPDASVAFPAPPESKADVALPILPSPEEPKKHKSLPPPPKPQGSSALPILLTVKHLCQKHSFMSEGGLRYLIFNAETNGLKASGALIRFRNRVLINEEKYIQYVENQEINQKGGK
ncbi:MAG: hypothetical protein ACI9UO_001604 [Nitrospinales bacterium]|jgi:hypothetical protein